MFKKTLIGLASVIAMAGTASAEEVSISGGVDVVSKYVFRGIQLADEAIQPYVEFGTGNFYGGVWFSTPIDSRSFFDNEVDLYGGYAWDVNESVSADVGLTRYIYTDSDGAADTTEFYGGLSFSAPIDPSIYVYYDVDLEATTIEGSGGYSWPLADASLDLGTTIGYIDADGADLTYFLASLGISQDVADNASVYASANFGATDEDTFLDDSTDFFNGDPTAVEDNGFWFAIGFSASN